VRFCFDTLIHHDTSQVRKSVHLQQVSSEKQEGLLEGVFAARDLGKTEVSLPVHGHFVCTDMIDSNHPGWTFEINRLNENKSNYPASLTYRSSWYCDLPLKINDPKGIKVAARVV